AKVDANDVINETNENYDTAVFAGGSYLLDDADSGQKLLEVHESDSAQAVDLAVTDGWLTLGSRSLADATHTLSYDEDGLPNDDGLANFDVTGDTEYNYNGSLKTAGVVNLLDAQTIAYDLVHTDRLWQNPNNRWDVNGDGYVAPSDVVAIINILSP